MTNHPDTQFAFSTLLDAMTDAIVNTDFDGRIVEINIHTVGMFGYSRGELVGEPVESLMPERYRGKHVGQRDDYAGNPHVRPMGLGMALFGLKKDGQEFPIEISLSPYHAPQGPLVVAAIRDVSARKSG